MPQPWLEHAIRERMINIVYTQTLCLSMLCVPMRQHLFAFFFNTLSHISFALLISISSFPINISHYVPRCMQQVAHTVFVWAVG